MTTPNGARREPEPWARRHPTTRTLRIYAVASGRPRRATSGSNGRTTSISPSRRTLESSSRNRTTGGRSIRLGPRRCEDSAQARTLKDGTRQNGEGARFDPDPTADTTIFSRVELFLSRSCLQEFLKLAVSGRRPHFPALYGRLSREKAHGGARGPFRPGTVGTLSRISRLAVGVVRALARRWMLVRLGIRAVAHDPRPPQSVRDGRRLGYVRHIEAATAVHATTRCDRCSYSSGAAAPRAALRTPSGARSRASAREACARWRRTMAADDWAEKVPRGVLARAAAR